MLLQTQSLLAFQKSQKQKKATADIVWVNCTSPYLLANFHLFGNPKVSTNSKDYVNRDLNLNLQVQKFSLQASFALVSIKNKLNGEQCQQIETLHIIVTGSTIRGLQPIPSTHSFSKWGKQAKWTQATLKRMPLKKEMNTNKQNNLLIKLTLSAFQTQVQWSQRRSELTSQVVGRRAIITHMGRTASAPKCAPKNQVIIQDQGHTRTPRWSHCSKCSSFRTSGWNVFVNRKKIKRLHVTEVTADVINIEKRYYTNFYF